MTVDNIAVDEMTGENMTRKIALYKITVDKSQY